MSPKMEATMRTLPTADDVAREIYQVLAHYKRTGKGINAGMLEVCSVLRAMGATTMPVVGHFSEYAAKLIHPTRYDDLILKFRCMYPFREFKFVDGQPTDKSAILDIDPSKGAEIRGWSKDDFLWACNTHRAAFGPERLEGVLTKMFGSKEAATVPPYAYGGIISGIAQEMACGQAHNIPMSSIPYFVEKPTFGKRTTPPTVTRSSNQGSLPPPRTDPLTGRVLRRKYRDNKTPPTPTEEA